MQAKNPFDVVGFHSEEIVTQKLPRFNCIPAISSTRLITSNGELRATFSDVPAPNHGAISPIFHSVASSRRFHYDTQTIEHSNAGRTFFVRAVRCRASAPVLRRRAQL